MLSGVDADGVLIRTNELDLELAIEVQSQVYGLKMQQYLHGKGEMVAHITKPEEAISKDYCFNPEEIARRLGNLNTKTCIEEQREVLKEVIALGNLGKLSQNDLHRLIAMDTALGNLL